MSTISEKTNELFMASSLSDDDLGYPNEVSFVPGDEEWADDVVWRNLIEGHPAVLVDEGTELLLIPLPRRPIDRLRGCVRVRVTHRPHGHIAAYATSSTLGRHPVREMRALAHA
jgi:hypothetical protein